MGDEAGADETDPAGSFVRGEAASWGFAALLKLTGAVLWRSNKFDAGLDLPRHRRGRKGGRSSSASTRLPMARRG